MRKALFALLLTGIWGLAACSPAGQPAEPEALFTATDLPTLTATIDWFPATATPTPPPTLAPTVALTPELGLSTSLLEDDFSDTSAWDKTQVNAGSIAYGKNELTIAIAENKAYLTSLRRSPELNNFYLEITINPSLCRGEDAYGLLLRAADQWSGIRWLFTCDGRTRVERLQNSYIVVLQDWITSLQIRPGAQTKIHAAVWMNGKEMRFYIEGAEQFRVSDPVYTSGVTGVFARAAADPPLTVNFSALTVRAIDPALLPLPTLTPSPEPTPAR